MDGRVIADVARNWEQEHGEVPYGTGPGQLDCSHFVVAVIAKATHSSFPYRRADEFSRSPEFRLVDQPEAGDLVHWPGHVAIVLDPASGTFIGSQSSTGVAESSYRTNPYWRRQPQRTFLRFRA